jgi:type IX secretion system PorP/SprF family membrane protein
MKNSIAEGNTLGLGFTIVNDQSNGGGLQNTSIGVSSAFHLKLDEDGYKTLGLGFQGTYQERKINLAKLYFEDQFTSDGFINTLPSATSFTNLNKTYFNANVGLLYNNDNPMSGFRWYAGAAASNLLNTDLSLSPDQVYQLPLKLTAHAGSAIALNDWTYLDLSAIYMQMGQTKNIVIGGAFDIGLDDVSTSSLLLGSWYRVGDAVIPYVGFRNNGLQMGVSYDVTTSSLKTMSQTRNAFEFSIIFNPSTADAAELIAKNTHVDSLKCNK